MAKILSDIDKSKFYDKVYEIPEFINKLDNYERGEILKYAEDIIRGCEAHTYRLFNETPQLIEMSAPKAIEEGYKREELWDYILSKDPQYKKALTVIQIISGNQVELQKELQTDPGPQSLLKPEIKPIFKPEMIDKIFALLKDFFSKEHQTELKKILQNGSNASTQLIFLSNGNRLAYTFKQLYEQNNITGCQKNELAAWIRKNFCYRFRDKTKVYTPRYLEDLISTNKIPCKHPLNI